MVEFRKALMTTVTTASEQFWPNLVSEIHLYQSAFFNPDVAARLALNEFSD